MKGYKAFDENLCCLGFQYEVGKTYEMEEPPIICERGFHFCKELKEIYKYYPRHNNTRVCEVEALGIIVGDDYDSKYCTNKIRIVWELTDLEKKQNEDNTSTGYFNTGTYNTGDYNSGNHNTGNRNEGSHNAGSYNSGSCNTGRCNNGMYNTGNYNFGNYNSGDFNLSNYNTGAFNTKGHTIMLFDEPSNYTEYEWCCSMERCILMTMPSNIIDRQAWWDDMDVDIQNIILNIPNFDYDIFEKCTGINAR